MSAKSTPSSVLSAWCRDVNATRRSHYLSNEAPDEVTVVKCYGSAVDGARTAPHSAFVDTDKPTKRIEVM